MGILRAGPRALRARGPDARKFLQGQLSNDLSRLSGERALLAGYHNVQGRAIALLRLIEVGADDFIAILPRELVSALAARMSKFILRAKVKLSDESAAWQVLGIVAAADADPTAPAHAALLPPRGGARQVEGTINGIGERAGEGGEHRRPLLARTGRAGQPLAAATLAGEAALPILRRLSHHWFIG